MSRKTIEFTEDVDGLVPAEVLHELYVAHVLRVVNGNKSHAARILRIDRRTLYRRLESIARRERGEPMPTTTPVSEDDDE